MCVLRTSICVCHYYLTVTKTIATAIVTISVTATAIVVSINVTVITTISLSIFSPTDTTRFAQFHGTVRGVARVAFRELLAARLQTKI